MSIKNTLLILCLVLSFNGIAQTSAQKKKTNTTSSTPKPVVNTTVQDTAVVHNGLKMLISVGETSVKLRWALENSVGWKACNQYGFRVERYTVKRDSSWLEVPERSVLADPCKAKPLSEWETLATRDNFAAIMAQTLYGKDMQIELSDKNPLTQIVTESQDLQQRYTLSLLAADMSFEAAKMAAWGYEDLTVKRNERYLYRIIALAPKEKVRIDSAFAVVNMADYKPLPIPGKPDVLFGDSLAVVGFNYFFLRDIYIAFHVERSDDGGKTFKQITATPVTCMNEKTGQENFQFFYTDKLKNNIIEYRYRIKGINSFSEVGPVSEAVKGKGMSQISAVPHIISCTINQNGSAEIEWEYDISNQGAILRFELNQSRKNEGPYVVLQKNIDPGTRKLVVKKPEASNYYTITALGKNGQKHTSPKRFLQLIDSIPPSAPVVVSAVVDTLGHVHVEWKANTEDDLLGYKIFRANNLIEEAYIVKDSITFKTVFDEQLDGSMINRTIYYYIKALDRHFNESEFSIAAEAKRPDVTPPTSPIFVSYTTTEKGVYLKWARCEDTDVSSHTVLRKEIKNGAVWQIIAQFRDTTSQVLDKTAEQGSSYWYAIIAKDQSGLESIPKQPLKISLPGNPADLKLTSFKVVTDLEKRNIELQWTTDQTDIIRFELYKGAGEEPVTLWKIVDGKQNSIKDILRPDLTYEYMIRMVMTNGTVGRFYNLKL